MTTLDTYPVQVGEIFVSPQHNSLARDETVVNVQPRVMAVLVYLAAHADRVISNEELLEQVWKARVVTSSSVQKSINALRTAIARLDDQNEYVVHFSKRGYQMVMPVSCPKETAESSGATSRQSSPYRLGLIFLFVGVLFTLAIFGGWKWSQPATLEWQAQAYTYADPILLIPGVGDARAAEPHSKSGKIAFIRDLRVALEDRVRSELIVRGPNGNEWQLSIASSTYVDLAWSPSGRNLLALEADVVAGVGGQSDFLSPADEYVTFHIFTLDFKGERLLEKNLLSHWQGRVRSIYWRDDNTLEFIASQGLRPDMERYQYQVPNQALVRLPTPKNSQNLMLGDAQANKTALVTMQGHQYHLLFLDQNETVIGEMPLSFAPRNVNWLPGGSAVALLSATGNRLELKTPSGGEQGADLSFNFERSIDGRLQRIRFMNEELDILASVVYPQTTLEWSPLTEAAPLALFDAPEITAARISHDRSEFYLGVLDGGRTELIALRNDEAVSMPAVATTIERIDAIFPIADASGLYYQSGRELWFNPFDERQPEKRYVSDKDIAVITVKGLRIWAVVDEGSVKNIWRLDLGEGETESRQLSFGSIGSALASEGTLYFQYQSRRGLWRLDMLTDRIEQVTENLAQNVRLLAVRNSEIYFVQGGPCRESSIYALPLESLALRVAFVRSNPNVHTLDLHPDFGWLQKTCGEGESVILKFPRTDPRPAP